MKYKQELLLAATTSVVLCGIGLMMLVRHVPGKPVRDLPTEAIHEARPSPNTEEMPPSSLSPPPTVRRPSLPGRIVRSETSAPKARMAKPVGPSPLSPHPSRTAVPDASRTPKETHNAAAPPAPATAEAAPAHPITEPEAREALRSVGADPRAEAIWIAAINDPNLSADQRRNLIEDLNEEGLPNPKKLTSADLPLIMSRLDLIEKLAPDAIDEVNAEAFREAYKDLGDMFDRLTIR